VEHAHPHVLVIPGETQQSEVTGLKGSLLDASRVARPYSMASIPHRRPPHGAARMPTDACALVFDGPLAFARDEGYGPSLQGRRERREQREDREARGACQRCEDGPQTAEKLQHGGRSGRC
jgi:hypothetical protein